MVVKKITKKSHYTNSIYLYTMKDLDSTQLFNIFFQQNDHVLPQEASHQDIDNDFIIFGTIITTIHNYYLIDQIYSHKYQNNYDSVRESIKLKYFNGLMRYFDRIDVLQLDTVIDLIDEFGKTTIASTLKQLLDFYEQQEHYEKCTIIFKYLQKFL